MCYFVPLSFLYLQCNFFVFNRCDEVQTYEKSNLLSRLAHHFPFVNKLLGRNRQNSNDDEAINGHKDSQVRKRTKSPDSDIMESISENGGVDNDSDYETLPRSYNGVNGLRCAL